MSWCMNVNFSECATWWYFKTNYILIENVQLTSLLCHLVLKKTGCNIFTLWYAKMNLDNFSVHNIVAEISLTSANIILMQMTCCLNFHHFALCLKNLWRIFIIKIVILKLKYMYLELIPLAGVFLCSHVLPSVFCGTHSQELCRVLHLSTLHWPPLLGASLEQPVQHP